MSDSVWRKTSLYRCLAGIRATPLRLVLTH